MMTTARIYLATIIGSGTDEDQFRSVLDEHRTEYAKARRVFGGVGVMWMMANVNADNHALMLEDVRMIALPDFAPTTSVAGMGADDMAAIRAALDLHGVPSAVLTTAVTFRDLADNIGRHLLGQSWDVAGFFSI